MTNPRAPYLMWSYVSLGPRQTLRSTFLRSTFLIPRHYQVAGSGVHHHARHLTSAPCRAATHGMLGIKSLHALIGSIRRVVCLELPHLSPKISTPTTNPPPTGVCNMNTKTSMKNLSLNQRFYGVMFFLERNQVVGGEKKVLKTFLRTTSLSFKRWTSQCSTSLSLPANIDEQRK